MKNNELNKNILRAISIGLAATLTLMPTVTAFADDGEDGGDSSSSSSESSSHESHESESTEKSRDASDSAREAAEADHHEEHHEEEHHEEEHHEEEHHEEEHHEEEHHEESSNEQSNDGSGDSYVEPQSGASDESTGGVDPGSVSTDPAVSMMVSSIGPDAVPGVAELQIVSGVSGETDATIELVNTTAVDAQTVAGVTDPSVATLMNGVADTMGDIAAQSKGVDDAVDYADGLIEEYEETAEGASRQINATGLATSYAEGNINKANEIINDASNTANDIKNAPDGTYVTDEEKAAANETLESALNASNEALGLAETNLNTAAEALGYAEKAVQDAEEKKKEADEAVKDAKDSFKALLKANGISYTENGDEIVADTDDINKIGNGMIKTALENAEAALNKAISDADQVQEDYEKAYSEAETIIKDAYKAVLKNKEDAENAYNMLSGQKSAIEDINTWNDSLKQNSKDYDYYRTLAYYMLRYNLTKDGKVDADKITVLDTKVKNGVTLVNNDGSGTKGFNVTYEENTPDGIIVKTVKYNYKFVDKDGNVKDQNGNDFNCNNYDHIKLVIVNEDKSETDVDGLDNFSTKITELKSYLDSESNLNTTKELTSKAAEILGTAETVLAGADGTLDKAKENRDTAVNNLNDVNALLDELVRTDGSSNVEKQENSDGSYSYSFKEDSRIDLINEKQNALNEAIETGDKNKIMPRCRELAAELIMRELEKGGATELEYAGWSDKGNSVDHYGTITYKDKDGVPRVFYFDYVALNDDNPNVADNLLDANGANLRTISYIKVVEKGQDSDGKVILDGNKGITYDNGKDYFYNGKDFDAVSKTYSSDKTQYDLLIAAKGYAENVAAKAQEIVKLKENLASATQDAATLKDKVQTAYDKVKEAARALTNAKLKQNADQKLLDELNKQLDDARNEYNTAKDNLAKAREKKAELENLVNEAKSVVASQKKVTNNSHHKSHKSDDTVEAEVAAPSVDTVMITAEAPNLAAPAAGDTASVITLTDTTFAAPEETVVPREAAFTAAPGVESAVLGDTAAPETTGTGAAVTDGDTAADEDLSSDVLGERMAPIVDAVKNGNFSRAMLFNEEAKGIPMGWWLLFFVLGATGVGIYVNYKKRRG